MESDKVIKSFLENAPPGEYEQCYQALEVIASDQKDLVQNLRESTLKKWMLKNYSYVQIDKHAAIICDEAQISDSLFIDPVKYTTFQYDFTKNQVLNAGGKPEKKSSNLRKEVQAQLTNYVNTAYHENSSYGCYDLPDGSMAIVIRSSSVSIENFRTGNVISRYIFKDNLFSGETKMFQHFFEGGNVMCENRSELKPVKITEKKTKDIAAHIAREIETFESNWLKNVNSALSQVSDQGLKKLRRKIPITRTKFDWRRELTIGH